jgi:hypothetical protein
MKIINMRTIIIISVFINYLNSFAQNKVGYLYDNNGNRYQRYFIGFRAANTDTSSSIPSDTLALPNDSSQAAKQARAMAMQHGITVYPNPTKDLIIISIHKTGYENQKANMYLMDNTGKTLDKQIYYGNELTFDLGKSPPGTYYLKVVFENKEALTYQVIKVN